MHSTAQSAHSIDFIDSIFIDSVRNVRFKCAFSSSILAGNSLTLTSPERIRPQIPKPNSEGLNDTKKTVPVCTYKCKKKNHSFDESSSRTEIRQ